MAFVLNDKYVLVLIFNCLASLFLHTNWNLVYVQRVMVIQDVEALTLGLNVAQTAGVPKPVIQRAEEVSEKLRMKSSFTLKKRFVSQ